MQSDDAKRQGKDAAEDAAAAPGSAAGAMEDAPPDLRALLEKHGALRPPTASKHGLIASGTLACVGKDASTLAGKFAPQPTLRTRADPEAKPLDLFATDDLSLQAAQLIQAASNPLATLAALTASFPALAHVVANETIHRKYRMDMQAEAQRISGADSALLVNGLSVRTPTHPHSVPRMHCMALGDAALFQHRALTQGVPTWSGTSNARRLCS